MSGRQVRPLAGDHHAVLEGVGLDGSPLIAEVVPSADDPLSATVLLFLSESCLACRPFWVDLADAGSKVASRAHVAVILERPERLPVDVPSTVPIVVAPGALERYGGSHRPHVAIAVGPPPGRWWSGTVDSVSDLCAEVARAVAGTAPIGLDLLTTIHRTPATTTIELDGSRFAFHPGSGRLARLDGAAAMVWDDLTGPTTGRRLADGYRVRFDVTADVIDADVLAVITGLVDQGFAGIGPIGPTQSEEARRGPAPVEPECCGGRELDRLSAHPKLVVDVDGWHVALHVDDATTLERLRDVLGDHLVDDPLPSGNLTLEAGLAGGGQPATLWVGAEAVRTAAGVTALVPHVLAVLASYQDPTAGWARLDGDAWIDAEGAVAVCPGGVPPPIRAEAERSTAGRVTLGAPVFVDLASSQVSAMVDRLAVDREALTGWVGSQVVDLMSVPHRLRRVITADLRFGDPGHPLTPTALAGLVAPRLTHPGGADPHELGDALARFVGRTRALVGDLR